MVNSYLQHCLLGYALTKVQNSKFHFGIIMSEQMSVLKCHEPIPSSTYCTFDIFRHFDILKNTKVKYLICASICHNCSLGSFSLPRYYRPQLTDIFVFIR